MNNTSDFREFPSNINPTDQEQKYLNSPISLNELNCVITNCSSSSPGPEEIPYSFIHNLPLSAINFILRKFNKMWDSGQIPKHWKNAFIIPILKPGKNKFDRDSYRPISLLNTMGKILEKIIDTQLRWFLEKNNYLSPHQNRFRKNKSTYNNLHGIQNDIGNKNLKPNKF